MIGTGSLYENVRAFVYGKNAGHAFTFIDRLPHDQIPEAHRRAHIYVSLNQLGQLSNANLEAMAMGACMIIPEAQLERGIDEATQNFISNTAVVRIPWDGQEEALASAIQSLAESANKRRMLSNNLKGVVKHLIPTWDERVALELSIISDHLGTEI
jgi:hypothetical protein